MNRHKPKTDDFFSPSVTCAAHQQPLGVTIPNSTSSPARRISRPLFGFSSAGKNGEQVTDPSDLVGPGRLGMQHAWRAPCRVTQTSFLLFSLMPTGMFRKLIWSPVSPVLQGTRWQNKLWA